MTDDDPEEQQRHTSLDVTVTALDLVLAEWLSAAHVTTLVIPKLTVANMCAPPLSTDVLCDNGDVLVVRVEAFGSGAVIVPSLRVAPGTTPVGEILSHVSQAAKVGRHDVGAVRLMLGPLELNDEDPAMPLNGVLDIDFVGAGIRNVVLHAIFLSPREVAEPICTCQGAVC